jgi:hypothetical protein
MVHKISLSTEDSKNSQILENEEDIKNGDKQKALVYVGKFKDVVTNFSNSLNKCKKKLHILERVNSTSKKYYGNVLTPSYHSDI